MRCALLYLSGRVNRFANFCHVLRRCSVRAHPHSHHSANIISQRFCCLTSKVMCHPVTQRVVDAMCAKDAEYCRSSSWTTRPWAALAPPISHTYIHRRLGTLRCPHCNGETEPRCARDHRGPPIRKKIIQAIFFVASTLAAREQADGGSHQQTQERSSVSTPA